MKIISRLAVVFALVVCATGCTDASTARRALEALNLEPVTVGGYSWFGCSEEDAFHTRFTAKNAKGMVVTGVVCSGWFKGNTVRFD